jgi:hypothetical protein
MSMLKKLMVLSAMSIGLLFAGAASAKNAPGFYGEIKYWGGNNSALFLNAGYQMNSPYAIELGLFAKEREVKGRGDSRNWSHVYLAGKRSFEMNEKSAFYAKLGIGYSDFNHEVDTTKNKETIVPMVAIGAEYKLWKSLYGIVDLSYHGKNHEHIKAITIGLGF